MTLISIIIPTYNRIRWLSQAIESALSQTYSPIEVVVVDDGSTNNNTLQLVSQYPVRYIWQENAGLGAARNKGLSQSKGEWIQFLDDDDWLLPQAIGQKYKQARKNSSASVIYSDLYLANEQGAFLGEYYARRKRPLPTGDIFDHLIRRNFIPIHALLWRRDVLSQVGGFPSRTGAEDWECLAKSAEIAHFDYVDQPLGVYRLHQENISLNAANQVHGDGIVQQQIVNSLRFEKVAVSLQLDTLVGYAWQQWRDGDEQLARVFYERAIGIRHLYSKSILLSILMALGKPASRRIMHVILRLRMLLEMRANASLYFATQKIPSKKAE